MHRWRKWLPQVLVQSALIVFSVLLALALAEWREGRRQAGRVDVAVEAIRAELLSNRRAVERTLLFHRATHDTLAGFAAAGQHPPRRIYYDRGMFKPAPVVATAWESARGNGVTNSLPYDLVLTLSAIYASQRKYEALGEAIAADVYADVRSRGPEPVLRDGFRGFVTLAEDFARREANLLEDYDSAQVALHRWWQP